MAEPDAGTEVVLVEVKGGAELVLGGFKTGWVNSLELGLDAEAEGTVDGEADGLEAARVFPVRDIEVKISKIPYFILNRCVLVKDINNMSHKTSHT